MRGPGIAYNRGASGSGQRRGLVMNIEKFPDRAKGFLQAAQTIGLRENHQQITPEHLLKALLDDKEGMAAQLMRAAGADPQRALRDVDAELGKLPKVEGGNTQ